jgi:23S rRNA (uracil1939-C5)-methyltransferase
MAADVKKINVSHPEEVYTLEIHDLNNLGSGVGRLPDGLVCFVRGAVTGDTVRVKIIKRTASFTVGRLEEIITPSPMREEVPFCTAPEACGGCVYRHLKYGDELVSKHNRVKQAFRQAGLSDVVILPPLFVKDEDGNPITKGYRNKGMYPVGQGKRGMEAGFYAAKSHKLIPCTACSLQPPVFTEIVAFVCDFCDRHGIPAYDEISGKGILRHIYLRTTAEGEIMLCLVINAQELPGGKRVVTALIDEVAARFPQIVSIQLNINRASTNVVLGDKFITLHGTPYMEDVLCGLHFRISGGSFYQVNHDAAELLYNTAAERAELTGREHLWDLYCGAGTIGLSMASRAASVTGIEIVPEAVGCAKENAALNAELGLLAPDKARFFCADAGDAASIFAPADRGDVPHPDVVVIDPPRKGTTAELIRELARRDIRRVVYISCDPETLGRDCAVFREEGYEIGEVQPVDLFPRTGHIENVVCLIR